MRQVEVSRTLVLDDPRRARCILRGARRRQHRDRPPRSKSRWCSRASCADRPSIRYQARIFTSGTEVRIDFRYKHSRVKQYLKDGRALRIETVINRPDDLDVKRRLQPPPRTDRQSPRKSTNDCL